MPPVLDVADESQPRATPVPGLGSSTRPWATLMDGWLRAWVTGLRPLLPDALSLVALALCAVGWLALAGR